MLRTHDGLYYSRYPIDEVPVPVKLYREMAIHLCENKKLPIKVCLRWALSLSKSEGAAIRVNLQYRAN